MDPVGQFVRHGHIPHRGTFGCPAAFGLVFAAPTERRVPFRRPGRTKLSDGFREKIEQKRGPKPPHYPARSMTFCRRPRVRYFLTGAAVDASLATGAGAFADAGAVIAVGPVCGATAFPFAFCSAM